MSHRPPAGGDAEPDEGGTAPRAPRTRRGRATRERVLAAAAEVFLRDGWAGASVPRIAAAAGVAHGTFYTYFDSKADVLSALLGDLWDDIYAGPRGAPDVLPRLGDPPTAAGARAVISASNRRFLDAYERNARLMGLVEQLATDPHRMIPFDERRQQFVDRAERFIVRLQADGLVDAAVDPRTTAAALIAMMRHLTYTWLVRGDPFDGDQVRTTIDLVWVRTLGLDDPSDQG